MMAATILSAAVGLALLLLSVALLLTVLRIVRGPTLADRVLGLDMLVAVAIGFIAVIAIRTGFDLYIDIAIALGLVGFLATVAFSRFILVRGLAPEHRQTGASSAEPSAKGARPGPAGRRKRRRAR